MLNILKMDFYRFFHMKSSYILILVLGAFFTATVLVMNIAANDVNGEDGMNFKYYSAADEGFRIGFSDGSDLTDEENPFGEFAALEQITLLDLIGTHISGMTFAIFLSIFCVLFVCGENSCGFIKNIAGKVSGRFQLALSKLLVMIVFLLIEVLFSVVVSFAAGKILFGSRMILGSINELAVFLGVQILLHSALISLVLFLNILFRNTALCMVLAIALCSNFAVSLISLLDRLKLQPFQLTDYTLGTNIMKLPGAFDAGIYGKAIILSVVFLLLYNAGGIWSISRQDIK